MHTVDILTIAANNVRALAVTTAKRFDALPNLPTMAEAGLPTYETSTSGDIDAPAGASKAMVAKLNAEMNKTLAMPDIREKLQGAAQDMGGGTPQPFADFIDLEITKWGKVAKDAGIQPE